jgi:hypothetical protein
MDFEALAKNANAGTGVASNHNIAKLRAVAGQILRQVEVCHSSAASAKAEGSGLELPQRTQEGEWVRRGQTQDAITAWYANVENRARDASRGREQPVGRRTTASRTQDGAHT